jgi:hypothetical protein
VLESANIRHVGRVHQAAFRPVPADLRNLDLILAIRNIDQGKAVTQLWCAIFDARQSRATPLTAVLEQGQRSHRVTNAGRVTVTPQPGGNGVAVSKVDPDGTAADRVKSGDVILETGGRKVTTAVNLRNAAGIVAGSRQG